jgi:hypothetical protein
MGATVSACSSAVPRNLRIHVWCTREESGYLHLAVRIIGRCAWLAPVAASCPNLWPAGRFLTAAQRSTAQHRPAGERGGGGEERRGDTEGTDAAPPSLYGLRVVARTTTEGGKRPLTRRGGAAATDGRTGNGGERDAERAGTRSARMAHSALTMGVCLLCVACQTPTRPWLTGLAGLADWLKSDNPATASAALVALRRAHLVR